MVVLGDFNAKSISWYTNDGINFEGSKVDFLTSSFGFHRIVNKKCVFSTCKLSLSITICKI